MAFEIRELETVEEVAQLKPLLREYIEFVSGEVLRLYRVDIPASDEVARTLSHLDHVVPPLGRTFAAFDKDRPDGMVFVRPAGTNTFEIKRLYVRPALRGTGAGRALAEAAIAAVRALGGKHIVLDSTKNLTDAARLYRSLGFTYRDAYEASDHGASAELAAHMIFMELTLD